MTLEKLMSWMRPDNKWQKMLRNTGSIMNDIIDYVWQEMTHHNENTWIASGGFHNSLQKMESIDGELDNNNCYSPSAHHSGGLILANWCFAYYTRLQMRI